MKLHYLIFSLLAFVSVTNAQIIDETIYFDDIERSHKVFLPTNFESNLPLVLNLHGYTSNAFQQYIYSNMTSVAEENDFIVVFPNGTTDQYGVTFWNSEIAGEDVDDLGYLSALIDSMIVTYQVNPNRVYMCGMSNGGFMSYYSACQITDKLAAIASVTGTMNNVIYDNCNPTRAIPVLEIHGTDDATVPYSGLSNSGSFQTMIATEDVVDFWINHNNCVVDELTQIEDINVLDFSTVSHFSYTGGDNGATVELYRVNNGGHTWPGSPIPLTAVTNQDIDASEVIWNFFNQYDVDGLLDAEEVLDESSKCSISPNPMAKSTMVESSFKMNDYSIYDMEGKVVSSASVNDYYIEIDRGGLPAGIYLLEVNGENKTVRKQLSVQ